MGHYDALSHEDIDSQREWSDHTFGPGERLGGVVAHIREELTEVEAEPGDIAEWADLLILAIDGATRQGFSGADLIAAYHDKMLTNRMRQWPDWRDFSEDEPINHVRDCETPEKPIESAGLLSCYCSAPDGVGPCPRHDLTHEDHVALGLRIEAAMPDEYPTGYARHLAAHRAQIERAEELGLIEPGRCPCGLPGCSDAAYHRAHGTGAVFAHEEHPGVDEVPC